MVLGPMLWSLSTTDKSMLLIATRVETFTLSWESKIKQVSILGFKITKKLLKYIKPDIHKCECAGRKEKYSNYSNCVFFFFFTFFSERGLWILKISTGNVTCSWPYNCTLNSQSNYSLDSYNVNECLLDQLNVNVEWIMKWITVHCNN